MPSLKPLPNWQMFAHPDLNSTHQPETLSRRLHAHHRPGRAFSPRGWGGVGRVGSSGCWHSNWQQFGETRPAASHVEVNLGSACAPSGDHGQHDHAQHRTTGRPPLLSHTVTAVFRSPPPASKPNPSRGMEGKRAHLILRSEGESSRRVSRAGRGRRVRGDSGTPRSAQAAWAGNPGGVAAGRPAGLGWGPPRAPYP